MARSYVHRLWQSFLQLNIYKKPSSTIDTVVKERYATRLYIILLMLVTSIIIITAAFIVRTVNKIEYAPSVTRFSYLANKHSNTLYCPCSTIGIAYNTFVNTHVHFHQVCSSQFVQQTWIDMVFAQENNFSLPLDDFRLTLSFFWQVIASFCNISSKTWTNIEIDFNAAFTFNPVAVAEPVIRAQVQQTLNNTIYSARTTLTRNLLAIRRIMSGNQIVSALATNYYLHYPPDNSSSPKMSPRQYGNCSCFRSQGCPHPALVNDSYGHLIPIPGMIADCLIMDGTLASTLECYYNRSCLSLLHQSLPITIGPMSSSLNKYFLINSTVETLLNEIMIDEIINDIQFDSFYSQCSPVYCSYSYAHRFDVVYVATTVIGVFGSLSFVLRMLAPLIATAFLRWQNRRMSRKNASDTEDPQSSRDVFSNKFSICTIVDRLRLLLNYVRKAMVDLNLFESRRPRTPINIFREQILTRLFLVLLIITSIAAGFYAFFVVQNQVVSVAQPSFTTYQQLYNDYSETLQCLCSHLSVPYSTFLNVTFILHEVCSSDFVSSEWLTYLEAFDPFLLPLWITNTVVDFRSVGGSYFQLLSIFCSRAKQNIEDSQNRFKSTQLVNDHLPTPLVFAEQTQAIVDSYIINTINDFRQTFDWIIVTFNSNYLFSGANMNFAITIGENDTVVAQDAIYTIYDLTDMGWSGSQICTCPRNSDVCLRSSVLYINASTIFDFEQIFSEVPAGCTPFTGTMRSTFMWWYNETYFNNIQASYAIFLPSQSPPNISSLTSIVPSRFTNSSLLYMIEEMFLERWNSNDTHFDQFFSQCAPSSCSYTTTRRRDLLVAFLLLISIYDGLRKILQLLVRGIGRVTYYLIDWRQHQSLSPVARSRHFCSSIYRSVKDLNLYKNESSDEMDLRQQRVHTRIYLLLFLGSLGVILFYNTMVERSITRTYSMPSIDNYEHLLDTYANDLSCPCTRISIPYKEFVTDLRVQRFHQTCSTSLVSLALTAGRRIIEGSTYSSTQDFRNYDTAFYTSLQQLCELAQESANDSINIFKDSTIFVKQLISRSRFESEINETLTRFQANIPVAFARTVDLIRGTIQGNALMAIFSTSWKFITTERGQGRNASFRSVPITYIDAQQNITCSCATSATCTLSALVVYSIDMPYYIFEGLKVGCYILETVLYSSLSCFYSVTCIRRFRKALQVPERYLMLYNSLKGTIPAFNISMTRFSINDTIETLVDEMFIESWTSNVSYERFFNSCAPTHCSYEEYYKFDGLVLLTTFLSVYVGLSLGIHFMAPYVVKMIKKIRNNFRVAPSH